MLQGDLSSLVGVCEATSCSSFTESLKKSHNKSIMKGKQGTTMVPVLIMFFLPLFSSFLHHHYKDVYQSLQK